MHEGLGSPGPFCEDYSAQIISFLMSRIYKRAKRSLPLRFSFVFLSNFESAFETTCIYFLLPCPYILVLE